MLKEAVEIDLTAPALLEPFGTNACSRVRRIRFTAKSLFQLHGSDLSTDLLHEEGDISILCQYDLCAWIFIQDHRAPFHTVAKYLDVYHVLLLEKGI